MRKNLLKISSAKLTAISFGLLLAVFCTIGMSFTPADEGDNIGDPNDTTYVTGPRRSHWTTSGDCGGTDYHNKTDYARTVAKSMNVAYGTVEITAKSKGSDPVTTADGSQSYVDWDTGIGSSETKDEHKDLEVIHTNTFTFTATPTDLDEYYFVGWYSDADGNTQVSTDNPWEDVEVKFPNQAGFTSYKDGSGVTTYEGSTRYTVTYYAKFAQIPAINVTFLAASTSARDNGYYTVAGKGVSETIITTSNQTIGVKGITLTAYASEKAEFVRWYTEDGAGNRTTISEENPCVTSFTAATKVGVEWRELTNHHKITFLSTDVDANGDPIGSYTVDAQTVNTSNYVYNTGDAYKYSPTLTAALASGYMFTGWYTKHGKKKDLLSTSNPWNPTFTQDSTIYAGFAYNNYTDDQKAQFKVGSTYYTDLNAANTAAAALSKNKYIICTRDGILPPGNYTISSGVTLYIPYNTSETPITKPAVLETATALSAYRTLTFTEGANINVNGNICVGGQIMAGTGSTHTGGYPHGACGMIDMSKGGHIELNNGANLYAWGFVKGQDMDQGNNTINVGTVTANSGSSVWEDFSYGDFRGGGACSTIKGKESSWKFFPFQSYSIHNVEIPVTFKYGSADKNYTCLKTSFGTEEPGPFIIIGSSNSLFKLKDSKSTVRKWYDPTTDLMCYELSGTSQLDALEVEIYVSVNSANYNLPIASNMHIILADCDMTLSKPMLIQPGAVIEIKNGASATLSSNMYLFDVDNWGMYVYGAYFKPYKNLTSHKNRGDGSSKDLLDDAKLIVDGTLNVTGKLYSTAGGANIMGNGGGKIIFSTLPSATNIVMCTSTATNENVAVASANLCNDDASYTKSIASTTFYNIHGRWFTADDKDEKEDDHTYKFTYITSGAVSGTGGTSGWTPAVYSWDKKAALDLTQKWHNVTADACSNWWVGSDTYFYNWTESSDWHQFIPTATEGMYSGSNNKIYTKTDCVWEELGETDVNCLYTIGGVKKALVDGQFLELEPNAKDPAYHLASDENRYFICFSGCNWHEATKYENAEKAYVVDEDIFIWYDGEWMNAEWRDPFFYTLDETNVPIYYEYLNGEWVLSDPYIRVIDGLENRTYWFLDEAFAFASGALRKTPTIKILRDISGITTAVSYTGANKTCTLDLNGHSITGSVSSMLTINGAGCTFIIEDNNTEGKEGKINLYYSYNGRRYAVNVTKGHLKLKGGTISSINTLPYATGQTSTTSCAIIVKASQQCTIEGGKVYAQADHNPFGIYGEGNSSTITVKGGEVIASVGAKTEPRGIQVTGGTLNVQDDAVIEATTYAGGTTGEGILVNQTASYHATLNMTGGTVKSTTKSSSIGVYVNCTYTYDTNEPRTITAWSRAEAYISGGEIRVENKNGATAEGVRSLGTTEISGGKITVRPTTSTAIGVRLYDGTTTIKGTADIDVAATSVAYGVRISEEAPANKAGTVYNGTLNMTGGTLTVRTTGTTDAYGVYVGAASTKITTTHASNSSYYAGNYANAGTANISNGVIDVQAKTNKAYSVYVENPVSESGATGYETATATPNCSITGGKFKVASMTASATNIAATNVSTSTYTISGGYYNNQENVAGYTTAPKHVITLPTTDANYPEYLYKVANSYLVTFMNGSETLQSTYQEEGKVPTYTEAEPTKASAGGFSYAFNGWSTSNDNTPAALTAVTSAGATYYACFEQTDLRYTISLDATTNGGECATEYIRVAPGAAAGELPSATKEGHTFTGWFTAASGGTQLTASTVVSGDITYYAQFTVNSYTLTYALGEGKVTTAGSPIPAKNKTGTQSQSVAYGTAITAPVVARTGYTFQSWDAIVAATMPAEDVTYTPLWIPNVNTKYTVKHYLQNVDGTYPTDPVETQSLTGTTATSVTPDVKSYEGFVSPAAQTVTIAAAGTTLVEYLYARRHYTFTLDAYTNGGTSEVSSIEVIHGATIGAVPPDAQKGCNDFTGWYSQPVGGVKITPEFVIEYDMKTLYAQFSDDVRTYPVIYNAGAHGTGAVAAGTKTCGEDATLSSSTFTRDGYTQTGWSLTDGGAQAYALGGTYTANASLTLYPVWAAVTYNLTYEGLNGATNSNPATYTIETATITLANPGTRVGYTFTGWTCGGNPITQIALGSTGDKTITANWSAVTYNLTYEGLNGATNSNPATYTIETATITLANPGTRVGYTFTGWTCGGNPITQIALGSTGDKTITANFVARNDINYTVKHYQQNLDGTYPSTPTETDNLTGTTGASVTPARKSYEGFEAPAGQTVTILADGSRVVTYNYTRKSYNLSWVTDGDVLTEGYTSGTVAYGTAITAPNTPTKTGYVFAGWHNGTSVVTPATTMPAANTTYTAQWTAVTYSLRFNKNDEDATGTMSNESFTYDVAKALTSNAFTKTGYNFAGWAATTDGEVIYENGQSVSNLSSTQDAVIDLYAKWTAATYEVTLDANGGSGGSISVTMTYNAATHTTITNPTRTGYTFHSWNTTASSSTRKQVISSKGVMSENVSGYTGVGGVWIRTTMPTTLYARWSQKSYTTTFTHNGNGSISYNGAVVDAGGTAKVYHVSAKSLVATPNTGYHFTGWTVSGTNASKVTIADLSAASTTIKATAASATVTAGFAPDEYTISYKDQGDAEFSGVHGSGYPTTHTYGTATVLVSPTKEGYTFDGWYDNAECTGTALTEIGATDYTADFTLYAKWTLNKYSFTIGVIPTSYGNVDVASITQIPHGSAVTVTGNKFTVNGTTVTATPTATTAEYTYAFSKWNNVPNTVTANVTNITAEFTRTINQYTLTVEANNDAMGTVSGGGTYDYNTVRTITASPKDGYKFVKWNDDNTNASRNVTVTADVTYTATFDYDIANYTVKHWQQNINDDGYTEVVTDRQTNLSGTIGTTTTAEAKEYTGFDAQPFSQQTIEVSGTVVNIYYNRKTFAIAWEVDGVTKKNEIVRYGATPVFGSIPTKDADVQYTYSFTGWTPTPYAAYKDQTYSGSFDAIIRSYTITFVNDNEVFLWSDAVNYGIEPSYGGSIPVSSKTGDGYAYTFEGWKPELAPVSGPATYTAVYSRSAEAITVNTHETVTNNTTASSTTVEEGGALTIGDGETPTSVNTNTTIVEDGGQLIVASGSSLGESDPDEESIIIVESGGQLEVEAEGSIEADVFIIEATIEEQGEEDAKEEVQVSGELSETGSKTLSEIYYDLTRQHGSVPFLARVWYAVAVPWAVETPNYSNGGVFIKRGEEFIPQRLGATFDLLTYDGECRAQNGAGVNCWVYLEDEIDGGADAVMEPGKLYMIYLTEETYTIRFKKKVGVGYPIHTNSLTVSAHNETSNADDANWNGIANPATYRAYMNVNVGEGGLVQKFVPGTQPRDGGRYLPIDLNDKQSVGQPFFVQVDPSAGEGTSVEAKRTNPSAPGAPRRAQAEGGREARYAIGIAANGKLADRLYIQTAEEKEDKYVIGKDMSKMSVSSYVAQMWVERYGSKLCQNTMALTRDKATYPLGIYAPQAGEYMIFAPTDMAPGDIIYLTYDGRVIWNLTMAPYYASLDKGTTTHYGLRLVHSDAPAVTTGVDEVQGENAQCTKVIMDDHVYILRGEELYTITGQKAK